ncbi:MAG: hypothetical protein ACRED3_17720, partial [Bradyrhizobium sp.]
REVMLEKDHRVLLDAINDRGITRLAIPDRPRRDIEHRPKEEDAALDGIVSAILYSATGRVHAPDFSIRGNDRRTEYNPSQVLRLAREPQRRPTSASTASTQIKESDTSYYDWIEQRRSDTGTQDHKRAEQRRKALQDDTGLSTETYRFTEIADALKRL